MASVNKVLLLGNLTADVELRYTPAGTPVGNFDLALNERYKGGDGQLQERVTFVPVVVWGRHAEVCAEYLHKGRAAHVEGRLQRRDWMAQDGSRRQQYEVVAQRVTFLGAPNGHGAPAPDAEPEPGSAG